MSTPTKINVPIARIRDSEAEVLSMHPWWPNQLQAADLSNAYAANDCSISLPLSHGTSMGEQAVVIEQVTGSPV